MAENFDDLVEKYRKKKKSNGLPSVQSKIQYQNKFKSISPSGIGVNVLPTREDDDDDFNALVERFREEKKQRDKAAMLSQKNEEKRKREQEKANKRTWFQKGASEESISKTILGTTVDARTDFTAGALGLAETTVDTAAWLAPGNLASQIQGNYGDPAQQVGATIGNMIASWLMGEDANYVQERQNELAQKAYTEAKAGVTPFIQKDLIDEQGVAKAMTDYATVEGITARLLGINAEEASVLGDKSDSLVQSAGQLATQIALGKYVPWWVTSGISAFGGETENALKQGATFEEAGVSGLISAGAEVLTEKLSGGVKLPGMGATLDDLLTRKLATGISSKFWRTAAKMGIDVVGEGLEESLTNDISAFGQWLTYRDEEELKELLFSEEAMEAKMEAFIGGAILGGLGSTSQVYQATRAGKDYTTGLTEDEFKVVNKAYNELVKQKGKVSPAERNKLWAKANTYMDEGRISADFIESVLGGESYAEYKGAKDAFEGTEDYQAYQKAKDEHKSLPSLEEELAELGKKPNTVENNKKYDALSQRIEAIKSSTALGDLQTKLSPEATRIISMRDAMRAKVSNQVKDSRLAESYRELARSKQKLDMDASQYTDETARRVVQHIVDSKLMDNTNQSKRTVEFLAKLAADKGLEIEALSNEAISKARKVPQGATIHGYISSDGKMTLNMESPRVLQTTAGHEITHVFEGTKLYNELAKVAKDYCIAKEGLDKYNARIKEAEDVYGGDKNTTPEGEVVADLIGEYLFTDEDFVNNLSANKDVFERVYDEVKYLFKIAVAGSNEKRQLEKVKRAFDRVYQQTVKFDTESDGKVQNSIGRTKNMPLKDQLSDYYKGKFKRSDSFYFGKTPNVLSGSGLDAHPLAFGQDDFKKSTHDKHNIPRRALKKLSENLEKPIFSFTAGKQSAIVIDDIDGDGKPVVVAIHGGHLMDRKPVNLIKSVYGIDSMKKWVSDQIKGGCKFRVYDIEKANALLQTEGYLAEVGASDGFWDTITKTVPNVNTKFSYSSIANSFFGEDDMGTIDFLARDYHKTEFYKKYVDDCINNMRQTMHDFDESMVGEYEESIRYQLDGIVDVAVAMKQAGYDIRDTMTVDENGEQKVVHLDEIQDSKKRSLFTSLEPNSDYITSHDISTICDKRKNFAEIYDEIVRIEESKGVPKGKRFFDNVNNYFAIHKIMADKGLTTPCRQCYVESMRKNLAPMASAFLELVQETNPNNTANAQLFHQSGKNKGELKTSNESIREGVLAAMEAHPEYNLSADDLTIEMLTTEDGLAQLRIQAPLVYEAFNSFYGQAKPKMPKSATPFRFGELTAMLTDSKGKVKKGLIDRINSTGGFRLQSYSDFQIQNYADVLQVLFEAGTLGLNGHAYTKVPAFLDATDGTNLKRNISIFMYKDGDEWKLDRNDSFPYSLEEIYDIVKADKEGNTSIIAVSQNNEMSAWIMANDLVGYGIPFHKSGLKMSTVRDTVVRTEDGREVKGYTGTKDHTKQQTEVYKADEYDVEGKLVHKANTKVKKGIDIYNGLWDFENKEGLSRNELIKKNLIAYIDACEEAGYRPKFRDYVMNNDKVLSDVLRFSKELGYVDADATINDISFEYKGYRIPYGYYKFLGDFGMFTPDGKAAPQKALSLENYDFGKAREFFEDAEALRRTEILQQFANGKVRDEYRESDMTTEELEDLAAQKRTEVAHEALGIRASMSKAETAKMDSDYMDAVARKDEDTIKHLVREYAKASMPETKLLDEDGNPRMVYHGTNTGDFTVFNPDYIGMSSGDDGFFGMGFYFAYSKGEASYYGASRVIPAYLDLKNPFNFDKELRTYNGKKAMSGHAPDAVALMNFADKFPDIAMSITLDVAKEYGKVESISLFEFSKEFKNVIENKYFEVEETVNDYGEKETIVTADPQTHSYEYNGETVTYRDFGFQKRWYGTPNEYDVAYEYLSNSVYSYIDMPRLTSIILDNNREFTAELKNRGYDGTIQSEYGDEAVAFDPSQIKSAEPITYDDNGDVIPLTKRFDRSQDDIRYSMSKETTKADKDYLDAIGRGDTDSAQSILDEVAKSAGYTIKAYHGTGYDFTVFDKSKQGDNYQDWGRLGKGFYFAPTSREAETWAELSRGSKNKVMPVYLRIENMLDSFEALPDNLKDTIPEDWDSLTKRLAEKYAYNYIEYMQEFGYNVQQILQEKGYDGINGHVEFVVFNSEQVKSADPVTYDDKGNVIPLSERFNKRNEDIRFSMSRYNEQVNAYQYNLQHGDMLGAEIAIEELANISMADSKIRGEDGRLIPLYHGTKEMFYEFDPTIGGGKNGAAEGFGIYLSDDQEVTNAYGDRQIKLFANITKPATSFEKTITRNTLVKLIKDTCEKQAQQMVEEEGYDSIEDAIRDTWVSNYVMTYDMSMDQAYREVATSMLQENDNDKDIIHEVMFGMAIRDYPSAMKFYRESLTPVTGFDGFITKWTNSSIGKTSNIYLAFDSSQLKSADAVTYDNEGKEIPVTERFNPSEKDFRYSISKDGDEEIPFGYKSAKELAYNKESTLDSLADSLPIRDDINTTAPTNNGDDSDDWRESFEAITDDDAPPIVDNSPVKEIGTVEERLQHKIDNTQAELDKNRELRIQSAQYYDEEIARLQEKYDSKRNKNSKVAQSILRSIERLKRLKGNIDADYSKRISDLEARVEKMNSPEYRTAEQRRAKMQEHTDFWEATLGDTSTWKDLALGLAYKTKTLRRILRKVVKDANGKPDIAKADAIYDALETRYDHHEAQLKKESAKLKEVFKNLKLNHAEDTYAHMLGELRHNPQTTLTEDAVKEFYEKNKGKIDKNKVERAIAEARDTFDKLLVRVNEVLKEQGMKEIPYRKGYFPHFTNPKQSWLAKLFNWKTIDTEIPTSIAGLTEQFDPQRSWQGFNKQRKGDTTDYSLYQGLDTYIHGALDWIYHIDDLQSRRALENHIRYIHSEEGVKARIDEIKANEYLDADETQTAIEAVLAEARNPLNNLVTELRARTNTLANKKASMDRGMEEATNRKIYSTMTNLNNRINANMVVGSFSSALTNFIPMVQSWHQVSPYFTVRGLGDMIRSTVRDDGMVRKSDFLTNRLIEEEKLYQTGWDKVSDKAAFMMNAIDNITSQTVWRSKYLQNMKEGMSETEAIKDADQFAKNLIAGRSRGNMPTIFDAKNPLIKVATAFQLEVANQYGFMFEDTPQDTKSKARLVKGYATAFMGAYLYNALYSSLVGRDAAFDPISIIEDLLGDLFGDDEEEPEDIVLNLVDNILDELPYVSGFTGGGRIPISSALPYEGDYESFISDAFNGEIKAKEMLKPLYYLAMPVGGGQIKKTVEGLSMFDDDLPIAGSYTDSGALRFPVEDTFGNKVQAALFGQYASKNAREYFDNGYAPLEEKQIQEYKDLDIPIKDYWEYREGLKGLTKAEEKADYIDSLDLPISKKNIMVNNQLDRKEKVDMTNYGEYDSLAEFDFANENPEKYEFFNSIGVTYQDYARADEKGKDTYNWAFKNPDKYTVSKAVTSDLFEYRQYTSDLGDIRADKDSKGKTINGSAKKKKLAYINSLNIEYGAKLILYKDAYPSDDSYNQEIIEYINGKSDLTYEDRVTILVELGFTVKNGKVYWD